ncbi:CYTH domain-containing protein [Marinicrinis sediminis]|uniref:CYTH domain-containing protein n=1 Tax=Marinicrinis sediminis TaxID=1652465 RepID=A0ABW5R5J2_9BACL
MSLEIERKYRLTQYPHEWIENGTLQVLKRQYMEQTYLAHTRDQEVRIRKISDLNHSEQCEYTHTIKQGFGMTREEFELKLLPEIYEQLLASLGKIPLQKTRTTLAWETYKLEIDEYHQYDMQVVEVEFDSVEQAEQFQPPPWFGNEVGVEEEYRNKTMWAKLQTSEG